MTLHDQVVQAFQERFGEQPALVVRAPGRVNLIGEHTDYNDGFVLPMAIDRAVWIALRPRSDQAVRIHSLDFDRPAEFSLDTMTHAASGWAEYVKGTAWALIQNGYALKGWEGVAAGDVPIGAGLSSSAALELAAARAFAAVSSLAWDAAHMARLSQQAENEWVGVKCGIMDQMISAAGQSDHALLIDCRSLETQVVPLPPDTVIVTLDTATRRGLVDSAYNERRQQCEAAARFFGVAALRDATVEQFEASANQLDDLARRRARHVISENQRTLQAAAAMRRGDAVELGRLMDASHVSLRDDFEVSSPALNSIGDCARRQTDCYGARMTGAGFGGCAIALVRVDTVENFTEAVSASYTAETGLTPRIYICQASQGAEIIFQK
ncbi:MAG: galactokinase [Anaerolineae bacterium]|nr:galactokinase [Anaerolineae bacterium]